MAWPPLLTALPTHFVLSTGTTVGQVWPPVSLVREGGGRVLKRRESGVCSAWGPLLLCAHSQEMFVDDNSPILAPDLD